MEKIAPIEAAPLQVSKATLAPSRDKVRWIYDIIFYPHEGGTEAVRLSIKRQSSGRSVLEFGISPNHHLRWRALYGENEICLPDSDALNFEVAPDQGPDARLYFLSHGGWHNGRTIRCQSQEVRWSNGIAEVMSPCWLDIKDALAAEREGRLDERLLRRRQTQAIILAIGALLIWIITAILRFA